IRALGPDGRRRLGYAPAFHAPGYGALSASYPTRSRGTSMLDAISSRTQDLQALSEPALSPIDRTMPGAGDRTSVADGMSRVLGNIPAPGTPAPAERSLVASEDSVQAGGVRDAYDMNLY